MKRRHDPDSASFDRPEGPNAHAIIALRRPPLTNRGRCPASNLPEPPQPLTTSIPRFLAALGLITMALAAALAAPVGQAAEDMVTLNFVNADIDAVVKAVAEMTGRNFILDPKVKGVVNIVSARPVPQQPRLSDAAFGAAPAGLCRSRGRRHHQDRAGGRRQAAGLDSGHGRKGEASARAATGWSPKCSR